MSGSTSSGPGRQMWKNVSFAGRVCRVSGDPDDIYFSGLDSAAHGLGMLGRIASVVMPPDGVAIDAGANVGLSALSIAAHAPGGRVYAFEPVPETFEHLRATAASDPSRTIECIQAALGAVPGTIDIHIGPRFSAGSHVVAPAHAMAAHLPTITVPMTTLDAFVAERRLERVNLIKIDVEGFEAEVLDGAVRTIERFQPVVHLEFNSFCLIVIRNTNPRSFVEMLLDRFAYVFWLRKGGEPQRIQRGPVLHHFLHDHLTVSRVVDDLACCNDASWMARLPPAR